MIIPAQQKDGSYISIVVARQNRWFICPFEQHYHSGDKIEIGLELILCEDRAKKVMDEWESRND